MYMCVYVSYCMYMCVSKVVPFMSIQCAILKHVCMKLLVHGY